MDYEERKKNEKKRKRRIQGFLIFAVLSIPAIWMTINVVRTQNVRCTVCISYKGQEDCKDATASDKRECQRTGVDNACALIASGMTESIGCTTKPAVSVKYY